MKAPQRARFRQTETATGYRFVAANKTAERFIAAMGITGRGLTASEAVAWLGSGQIVWEG